MRNVACVLGLLGLNGCYHPPKENQLVQRFWGRLRPQVEVLSVRPMG